MHGLIFSAQTQLKVTFCQFKYKASRNPKYIKHDTGANKDAHIFIIPENIIIELLELFHYLYAQRKEIKLWHSPFTFKVFVPFSLKVCVCL